MKNNIDFTGRELSRLKAADLFRTPDILIPDAPGYIIHQGRRLMDLCSNDYLGLSRHPALVQAACMGAEKQGCSARASRLMSGTYEAHQKLEEATAALKGTEAALVLGSGFLANCGIIPALCSRHDAVFSDRLNHASIIDGIVLSRAGLFRYRHNDPDDLTALMQRHRKKFRRALVITESLFSMDGDIADIPALIKACRDYDAMLFVDEAHATGIFGKNGEGLVDRQYAEKIDVITGTFGKALGGYGAYAAVKDNMKQYLVNRCRTYIFSTALPPSVVETAAAAIEIIGSDSALRKHLLDTAEKFRNILQKNTGISLYSRSQIIPIICRTSKRALDLQAKLLEAGFYTRAVRPPTVPEGTARIRLSITANHHLRDLEKLAKIAADFLNNH